ncbi:MAG: RNA-directed DNA polymerase [Lysobacterales bacterium]
MANVTLEHFKRAAVEVGAHGDNDTLPFDIDNRFIHANSDELAGIAFAYFCELENAGAKVAVNSINALKVFSERLLAPAGAAGFRLTTKIHPFWNIYLNGLGVAIAEAHEPQRSPRAHSYRYTPTGNGLFDRTASWRAFREATISECEEKGDGVIVVQTDISSFYEHVYHHRLENCISDLFPSGSTVKDQIVRLLVKLSAGRSFGLPVGGQCSRILAELLMSSIDRMLNDEQIVWRRYVDDFVLVTGSQAEAYRALSVLSHALGDYGLSLNKSKSITLTGKHYIDLVRTQLGGSDDDAGRLKEIDLHFDPYSDTADADYAELRSVVQSMEVQTLLSLELAKGQPDSFLVTQIGRTLKLHQPGVALQLCSSLLAAGNLHAFRASWSTIMRGIATLCADEDFEEIFGRVDDLLDAVPLHSPHLLLAEASCLHYLRTLRFRRTEARARFVRSTLRSAQSETIKRACIDCWRHWKDRPSFISARNRWEAMGAEEQRMLWLAAGNFGDDGAHFRKQSEQSVRQSWRLGIERQGKPTFEAAYRQWVANGI